MRAAQSTIFTDNTLGLEALVLPPEGNLSRRNIDFLERSSLILAAPEAPPTPTKHPAPTPIPEKLPRRERVPAPPLERPSPGEVPERLPTIDPCRRLPTCWRSSEEEG